MISLPIFLIVFVTWFYSFIMYGYFKRLCKSLNYHLEPNDQLEQDQQPLNHHVEPDHQLEQDQQSPNYHVEPNDQLEQDQQLLTETVIHLIDDAEFGVDCNEYLMTEPSPPPGYTECIPPPKYNEMYSDDTEIAVTVTTPNIEPDQERQLMEETRNIWRALVAAGFLDADEFEYFNFYSETK